MELSGGINEVTHYLLLLSSRSRVLLHQETRATPSWPLPCSGQKNVVEGMICDFQALASKGLRSFSFDSQNPETSRPG